MDKYIYGMLTTDARLPRARFAMEPTCQRTTQLTPLRPSFHEAVFLIWIFLKN
jgi:hypothetical protein